MLLTWTQNWLDLLILTACWWLGSSSSSSLVHHENKLLFQLYKWWQLSMNRSEHVAECKYDYSTLILEIRWAFEETPAVDRNPSFLCESTFLEPSTRLSLRTPSSYMSFPTAKSKLHLACVLFSLYFFPAGFTRSETKKDPLELKVPQRGRRKPLWWGVRRRQLTTGGRHRGH